MGQDTITSSPGRRLGAVVLFAVFLGIAAAAAFFFLSPLPVIAEEPLQCLTCHNQVLRGHDKLGTGSQACWSCHLSTEMKTLHLASGQVRFPLSESPRLCAQCHQKRYDAWSSGTHGVPTWTPAEPGMPEFEEKTVCIRCHNPHRPQIVLANITLPHPEPVPPPPKLPIDVLLVVGGVFVTMISIVILKARQ
ncbi:MAG: hypothetical protein HYX85_00185 [Chloroflexi bacterium]|nr:hypothetical protein [Chloroflexota bacterium]